MPFPFDIDGHAPDNRGLYRVEDPKLRVRILPLFSFDPRDTQERPIGHGTAFRIDPWSRCATAYHVLEDLFQVDAAGKDIGLRDTIRLAALEVDGQGYGLLPIPDGAWRSMDASFSFFRIDTPFMQPARLRNLTELMLLRIEAPTLTEGGTPYLPVNLRSWHPKVGDRVMALGYPDLDKPRIEAEEDNSDRPFRPYLYASVGKIITVDPADPKRDRMWPVFRVEANWPGGMSGGPVFNEDGHVIGLVSTGFGEGGATATYFSAWDIPERIFLSLDPNNPNNFMMWGAFDATGALAQAGPNKARIEQFAADNGLTDIATVSVNPITAGWMRGTITYGTFPTSEDD